MPANYSLLKKDSGFQVIVADDYLADGIREIVCEFEKKYPELVRRIFLEKNLG